MQQEKLPKYIPMERKDTYESDGYFYVITEATIDEDNEKSFSAPIFAYSKQEIVQYIEDFFNIVERYWEDPENGYVIEQHERRGHFERPTGIYAYRTREQRSHESKGHILYYKKNDKLIAISSIYELVGLFENGYTIYMSQDYETIVSFINCAKSKL